MRNEEGVFLFMFATKAGMEQVLEQIPWMIHNNPLILNNWTATLPLKKDEVTKLAPSAKTTTMDESWGRICFARAMVKISSDMDFKKEVIMAVLNEDGVSYTREVISMEYEWKPPHCMKCKTFGHSLDTCPVNVSELAPSAKTTTMDEECDGFTEVKRRKNKGKKYDQQPNSRYSGGVKPNKPNPSSYRPKQGVPKTTCAHEMPHEVETEIKDHLDRVFSGEKNKSPTGGGKKNLVFSPKSKIHYFDSDGMIFDDLDQEVETVDYENGRRSLSSSYDTWMAFGGNPRDLGSFWEETNEITTLHQSRSRKPIQWPETASQNHVTASRFASDDVKVLATALGRIQALEQETRELDEETSKKRILKTRYGVTTLQNESVEDDLKFANRTANSSRSIRFT
ncbi:reverse transcriptase domain-containing protein [Tanacetum coccineum]